MLTMPLILQACRTTGTAATDAAFQKGEGWECLAFRPIRWSKHDTRQTVDQITEHNAVFEALCGEG